jgi:hypothetical protein
MEIHHIRYMFYISSKYWHFNFFKLEWIYFSFVLTTLWSKTTNFLLFTQRVSSAVISTLQELFAILNGGLKWQLKYAITYGPQFTTFDEVF